MQVNEYLVLQECVEKGIAYGIQRSRKHTDAPTEDQIAQEVEVAVMNEICGYFSFLGDCHGSSQESCT